MSGSEKRAQFAQNVDFLLVTQLESTVCKLVTALWLMLLAASVPEIHVREVQYRTETEKRQKIASTSGYVHVHVN